MTKITDNKRTVEIKIMLHQPGWRHEWMDLSNGYFATELGDLPADGIYVVDDVQNVIDMTMSRDPEIGARIKEDPRTGLLVFDPDLTVVVTEL